MSINWGWAAFLAAQMLASYLFLAITIYRTSRLKTPVLKTSGLAMLLAAARDDVRDSVGSVYDIQDAEKKAGSVYARLDGDKLVLVPQ